jgi:fructosamine-3-kinase
VTAGLTGRIEAALGGSVRTLAPLRGGDIAAVWRAELADGSVVAVKQGLHLAIEGAMLRILKERSRVPVPTVRHADETLLIMSYVEHDGAFDAFAETHLGDIVAALHGVEGQRFGFESDTLIGGLPQPNPPSDDWCDFFRDQRLLHRARDALEAGRLPGSLMHRIEALAGKLHVWLRNEARPSLIHGDLWSGNMLSRGTKVVALIDPALYYADPEIELAFMTLFGSVGKRFFARYGQHRPLRPGFFEERRDLYNLYPLLVHVRLFGGPYVAQVERTLARYGC